MSLEALFALAARHAAAYRSTVGEAAPPLRYATMRAAFDAPTPEQGMPASAVVDELVALSEGLSVLNAKAQREGIVLRPLVEVEDDFLGRLSFKAINPKFLLKYDE